MCRTSRLSPEPLAGAFEPVALDDMAEVRAVLVAVAARQEVLTYSQLLNRLGHRFTRPAMRRLCHTIGQVDLARPSGDPVLGVLVVRASDGLPGAGWWKGYFAAAADEPRPSAQQERFVRTLQQQAFRYWQS